jgi:hypothetical protein
MWAAKAAKMGFRWKVGDGKKIKFWEDNWLGNSSLAIQFWDLYTIVNEKTSTIADLWDGRDLKCTFRRTVNSRLGRTWQEIVQIASTIVFSEEEDALIWKFSSNGIYSSQSLYKVINFRGVMPVHIPKIWSLHIPPSVQFFLWLLFKNKALTRDNLAFRQHVEDKTCFFCSELETSQHLFFECVVAKRMWGMIFVMFNRNLGHSFEDIGICWLSENKFTVINIFSSVAIWALWKLRNDLCFQNVGWRNMEMLMMRIVGLAHNWTILCPANKKEELLRYISQLQCMAKNPETIRG